ncbi:putative aminotransferase class I and II family protein [Parathielavia hyrcaniae]|uniref:Aminotransferase class I and II family protein n=1 Tax=Parathielavia hyrcaniae TaxID=113614 RepID=A0AAN6PXB2_9PEZI|nr:putative aminotransferase class I and II family protein [Parathielavia hyrcaniae]
MRQWEFFEKSLANPWTPDCPDGVVNLSVAENALMHQEVAEFTAKNCAVDPVRHLTYGSGPKGSPRLRRALASLLNSHFRPREPVRYEDILVQSGVTAVIDSLAWAICNEGEGVIVPHPFYMGFSLDIPTRARAVAVSAKFQSLASYSGFDDVFDAEMNVEALDKALKGAQEKGIKVRAVLLTNPHNPLGRCYPVETLKAIASFCGQHKLHLISDEIYANSVFENPRAPAAVPFTSVLALDLADRIDAQLVHVTYGASKDFCANGLRLGMLHTRNQGLLAAIAGTSMLAWPPYLIQDVWASMLEDGAYTKDFFATNQQRLAEQYAFATQFLDEHGIPYYRNSNAGMFIWIDLRRYMTREEEIPGLSIHTLSLEDKDVNQQREREISNRCVANGVAIAMGTNFFTEELGWFRLSFCVSRQALEVGLGRMLKALREIKE